MFIVADLVSLNIVVVLIDFSLTVKAVTLIFISGCGLTISSAKEGNRGNNLRHSVGVVNT